MVIFDGAAKKFEKSKQILANNLKIRTAEDVTKEKKSQFSPKLHPLGWTYGTKTTILIVLV